MTQNTIQPFAVFAYHQPGFDEFPGVDVYTVHGGEYDRSSLSEITCRANGIEIRPRDVAPFADLPDTARTRRALARWARA